MSSPWPGWTRLDRAGSGRGLGGTELVGVVPATQPAQPLLGLRGITPSPAALRMDAGQLLATDAALEAFARQAGPDQAGRQGRRVRRAGLAVLALGGRLTSGPPLTFA